jgi:hypothetical protein
MRVSFDIDDTLICYQGGVECEPNRVPRLLRPWYPEPLRAGTKALMEELTRLGCSLWIYTTSSRSERYLKRFFRFYGIRIAAVVNQEVHARWIHPDRFRCRPSKYPPAFEIELHVDDSEGVQLEGLEHGFEVVMVNPRDTDWSRRVLEAVRARLARREAGGSKGSSEANP